MTDFCVGHLRDEPCADPLCRYTLAGKQVGDWRLVIGEDGRLWWSVPSMHEFHLGSPYCDHCGEHWIILTPEGCPSDYLGPEGEMIDMLSCLRPFQLAFSTVGSKRARRQWERLDA